MVKTIRVQINAIQFIFIEAKMIFEDSKSESQCDVSVTRIGDILSYAYFPQRVLIQDNKKKKGHLFTARYFESGETHIDSDINVFSMKTTYFA